LVETGLISTSVFEASALARRAEQDRNKRLEIAKITQPNKLSLQ